MLLSVGLEVCVVFPSNSGTAYDTYFAGTVTPIVTASLHTDPDVNFEACNAAIHTTAICANVCKLSALNAGL